MSRSEAYQRLADFMGLDLDETHIGMFRFDQCWKVLEFVDSQTVRFSNEVKDMSVLSSIAPSRKMRPPRIALWGGPKVGKSTFAAGFNAPVFQPIDKEEGIDHLDVQAFPVAGTFDDVIRFANAVANESHEFKCYVLDSASAFQPIVVRKALEVERVASEAMLGGGYGHQFDTVLKLWNQFLGSLDQMRENGVASLLIGHITTKRFDDPINGGYTKYEPQLPKPVVELIHRWADSILFANEDIYRTTEDAGFNKEVHRATGSGRRVLYTQARPSHPGGGRGIYGKLPYELDFRADVFRDAVRDALAEEKAAKEPAPETVAA
jgi:hypothetical protein